LSRNTIRRLERRGVENAPLWWYVNCAIALGVELDDVLDASDQRWRWRPTAPAPPGAEWLAEHAEQAERWRAEEEVRRRL
jgi:hypothetical protein